MSAKVENSRGLGLRENLLARLNPEGRRFLQGEKLVGKYGGKDGRTEAVSINLTPNKWLSSASYLYLINSLINLEGLTPEEIKNIRFSARASQIKNEERRLTGIELVLGEDGESPSLIFRIECLKGSFDLRVRGGRFNWELRQSGGPDRERELKVVGDAFKIMERFSNEAKRREWENPFPARA